MSYNYQAIIIGPPGSGKTTLAAALVARHLADGGIVFAHDPVHQYARYGCRVYPDAAAYRKAAAAATEGTIPSGAAIGGDAAAVVALAMEVGRRNNRADAVRKRILLVMDEMSLGASGSTWMDRQDNELQAIRRHLGVGIVLNVQQPNQLTSRFYSFATDVAIFKATSSHARKLDNELLLEPGTLERARVLSLAKFHYVHVRVGEGIVSDPL